MITGLYFEWWPRGLTQLSIRSERIAIHISYRTSFLCTTETVCFINFQETNSSPFFSIPVLSQRGHYSRFSQLQLVSSINIKASLTFVIMPLTPLKVCSMVSTCPKRGASPRPPLGASRACQIFRAAPRTIHWEIVSVKDYSVPQLIQNFKQLCPQSTWHYHQLHLIYMTFT